MSDDDAHRPPPGPPPEPPLELELAIEPRRRAPLTTPPEDVEVVHTPGASRHPPLGGGTAMGEGVAPAPRFGAIHGAMVLVAVGVIALVVIIYQRANRPNVKAIKSPYRSYVGMTVALPPGGGWKTDRRLRRSQTRGSQWVRFEAMFRGASVMDPDDLLLAFRVHSEGAFLAQVDLEQLRRQAQQISDQVKGSAALLGGDLECVADQALREDPAALCRGHAVMNGLAVTLGVYVWQPTTDDMLGLFYASVAPDAAEFEAVVRSAE
ncbi:MAG: hypothetical protein IPL61_01285 [Myxococcales bacterium]|nr:hypothetical protein [Myxococcales bacterium]